MASTILYIRLRDTMRPLFCERDKTMCSVLGVFSPLLVSMGHTVKRMRAYESLCLAVCACLSLCLYV